LIVAWSNSLSDFKTNRSKKTMKMAKPTEADIQATIDLSNLLDSICRGDMPDKMQSEDENDSFEFFDIEDHQQCKKIIEALIHIERSANLFRASMGLAVLLDPTNKLVDPIADTLEPHPDQVLADTDAQRYRHLKQSTTDCTALNANTDLANHPWIIMPKLNCFGRHITPQDIDSAVDAAIAAGGLHSKA
jgi:hypothetical protein